MPDEIDEPEYTAAEVLACDLVSKIALRENKDHTKFIREGLPELESPSETAENE